VAAAVAVEITVKVDVAGTVANGMPPYRVASLGKMDNGMHPYRAALPSQLNWPTGCPHTGLLYRAQHGDP